MSIRTVRTKVLKLAADAATTLTEIDKGIFACNINGVLVVVAANNERIDCATQIEAFLDEAELAVVEHPVIPPATRPDA